MQQECIPVGCVPSAAVAVSYHAHPLPHMPPAMHAPPLCMPPSYACPQTTHGPPWPWTEFLTHARENITFPQLLLQKVKISLSTDYCFVDMEVQS